MGHRATKLAVVFAFVALCAASSLFASTTTEASLSPAAAQRRATPPRRTASAPARRARTDYTNFDHATTPHKKACDSCHKFPSDNWKEVRTGDEAIPDATEYPAHSSCLDCHRQQFFARERPQPKICSVCHVGVTPRNTVRWPFPILGETFDASAKGRAAASDFGVSFPHEKHEGLFGAVETDAGDGARYVRASFERAARAREDDPAAQNAVCANCHQTFQPQGDSDDEFVTKPPKNLPEDAFWLKKGTFKTSPRDHASCFTCHSADGGIEPVPANCAACHKLLAPAERLSLATAHDDFDPKLAAAMGVTDRATLRRWAGRETARFRHEWPPHDLACTACHKTAQMNAAAPPQRVVPVMSCGGEGTGCHIEPTPDGLLNTVVAQKLANPSFTCTKCHVLNGRLPTPASHTAALPAATQK